ncbi:MAG: hypothetical protein A2W99_01650 [Bacteroidetes bacterium GWF2_33_16]|nr:MAG: hypothetical protein A2X00_16505 [Bacteroidetes bacterium GWE2_32_14]OFY06975.1 MAG: hypothetical protein A2W99_01650 [Bacteroidetes bacterium GWF2_33_16]
MFFSIIKLWGQSQGINYQAVIIDSKSQEIPGKDINDNILPNRDIKIRFTILDANGTIDYQEEHATTTDEFGMINVIIGWGVRTTNSPALFIEIDWNGAPKDLKVDISISETETFYVDFSYQELTFVPYAYHKNITATGTLIVDGVTSLKNRLNVTNGSPTFLTGTLSVDEQTTLHNNLTVNSTSNLNGQVVINTNVGGESSSQESYPLLVQGSDQGIAIKVNGTRSSGNYFATFFDDAGVQGRIEGQTTSELLSDPEYIFDNVLFANEIVRSTVDVAKAAAGVVSASSSSTACAGLGACVTAPIPSLIAGAIAEVVMESANLALCITEPILYNVYAHQNIGVTYQSGAGDYAEWLPKANLNETLMPGDIVGVKGGLISKMTNMAEFYMVISKKPIVLGNMPTEGKEDEFAKVAFMGQVPVKVFGEVKSGDYIIPGGNNNGAGIAVSPEDIKPEEYQKIVGIAWSETSAQDYSYVNVAVGLNTNDVIRLSIKQQQKITEQETEINELKDQLNKMNNVLAQVIPGYSELMQNNQQESYDANTLKVDQETDNAETVIYYEVTREQVLEGLSMAEQILKEKGIDINTHPFFVKVKSEPQYKESFINEVLSSVKNEMEKSMNLDSKSGKSVIKL